jgi:ABC-type dipeptide/oligopeptide/nickel transport system permease subunit
VVPEHAQPDHGRFLVGGLIFLAIGLAAILGNLGFDPEARQTGAFPVRLPPGPGGPLGTTSVGQSVVAQLAEAIPNSMSTSASTRSATRACARAHRPDPALAPIRPPSG